MDAELAAGACGSALDGAVPDGVAGEASGPPDALGSTGGALGANAGVGVGPAFEGGFGSALFGAGELGEPRDFDCGSARAAAGTDGVPAGFGAIV